MIKEIALTLFVSSFLSSPVFAKDLFEESYMDEKVREEIDKEIKKNEVIPPEEIARVQNQIDKKKNTKINNMRPEQAKDFVSISNYIMMQADETYKPNLKQDAKTFYETNFDSNVSELVKSSPDEY